MRTLPIILTLVLATIAIVLWTTGARPSMDGPCELRCSIAYTAEVRACEHEPGCLQQAHQKYDACVQRCEKK
jgi:hypothetical protein